MSVKQVSGGLVVEDFAGHGVYEGCGFVTVLLCNLCHALAFGEVAANDTVIALIAATFAGGKGMAVVDRQALVTLLIMLHTVAVLELAAIVHGYGFECTLRELRNDSIKGFGGGGCGLAAGSYDDFKTCLTLGEDKEGLPLAFCGAYDTVHFPMAKGQAAVYLGWAAVYGQPLGRSAGLYLVGLALFAVGLFGQMPVGHVGDIAPVYIAI